MSAIIDGELPIGGMSSSSSLVITFINALAFINPDHIDKVLDVVKQKYLEKYPKLKNKYSAHICNTADGIKL